MGRLTLMNVDLNEPPQQRAEGQSKYFTRALFQVVNEISFAPFLQCESSELKSEDGGFHNLS